MTEGVKKLAQNATVAVIARLAMIITPFLVTGLLYVGSDWLDGRFAAQARATAVVDAKVADLPHLRERVVVLETQQARGQSDQQDFQKQVIARMDRFQDAIITLSNTVAGLTATIKAENDRRH